MLTYQQALDAILSLPFKLSSEVVALGESHNRVLAKPVIAQGDMPGFDHATMDGYAVKAQDLAAASAETPVTLPIAGESAAGHPFATTLHPGKCIRISTGATVPNGADAVVPLENVHATSAQVTFSISAGVGASILKRGTNISAGSTVLTAGTRISAQVIALLASLNMASVEVAGKPRVAILTSGDEVKALGAADLQDGEIIDSSTPFLETELTACGCEALSFGIAGDTAEEYRAMFEAAVSWGDIVITTAGVSVGAHDVVGEVLKAMNAEIAFWKVAVRPGKPMVVALVAGKIYFGLPGNPLSAMGNTEIFVKPFLRKTFGLQCMEAPRQRMKTTAEFSPDRHRLFFVNAIAGVVEGEWVVTPLANQNSANLANAARGNAFIVALPGEAKIAAGSNVDVHVIRSGL